MATHYIAANDIGIHNVTLTAATVEEVIFLSEQNLIEVVSDGAAEVYYTLDNSEPTVGGSNCYRIPATGAVDSREPHTNGKTVVKLISSGAPVVSVQKGV